MRFYDIFGCMYSYRCMLSYSSKHMFSEWTHSNFSSVIYVRFHLLYFMFHCALLFRSMRVEKMILAACICSVTIYFDLHLKESYLFSWIFVTNIRQEITVPNLHIYLKFQIYILGENISNSSKSINISSLG